MSDEGQQEPSMEDILASIRKILSEDEEEEGGEEGQPAGVGSRGVIFMILVLWRPQSVGWACDGRGECIE